MDGEGSSIPTSSMPVTLGLYRARHSRRKLSPCENLLSFRIRVMVSSAVNLQESYFYNG